MGSIWLARRAGSQQARVATANRSVGRLGRRRSRMAVRESVKEKQEGKEPSHGVPWAMAPSSRE